MKKLNLPIMRKDVAPPRSLSMDDYLKFVDYYLKSSFNKKSYAIWKRKRFVSVPFSLLHAK